MMIIHFPKLDINHSPKISKFVATQFLSFLFKENKFLGKVPNYIVLMLVIYLPLKRLNLVKARIQVLKVR